MSVFIFCFPAISNNLRKIKKPKHAFLLDIFCVLFRIHSTHSFLVGLYLFSSIFQRRRKRRRRTKVFFFISFFLSLHFIPRDPWLGFLTLASCWSPHFDNIAAIRFHLFFPKNEWMESTKDIEKRGGVNKTYVYIIGWARISQQKNTVLQKEKIKIFDSYQ